MFYEIDARLKLFPVINELLNKLECFVPGKLFQPSITNILAEYENL